MFYQNIRRRITAMYAICFAVWLHSMSTRDDDDDNDDNDSDNDDDDNDDDNDDNDDDDSW